MGVSPWAAKLLRRKPAKLVAVALAKKAARVAWAVMTDENSHVARRLLCPRNQTFKLRCPVFLR